MKVRVFFVIVLFAFASCKTSQKLGAKKSEAIQKKLDELVATNGIPGLNFSMIKSDGNQHDFSSGYENITNKTKMTPAHFMLSGSIGKTYAVALLMKLVDVGKIALDDKILKHLPKEKWLNKIPNIDQITIRMLLSHTSGLRRWVMKPEVWETLHKNPDKVWTYQDRFSFIFGMKPAHEPNKGWAYSDTNYLLLGYLIETIEKKDYYELLKSKVLIPHKLRQTAPSNKRKLANIAMAYSKLPPSFHIPPEVISAKGEYPFNPQMEWTGGGVYSTTGDLAKWGHIYFTGNVFSDGLRRQMVKVNPNGEKVYGKKHSYGMGSFIYNTRQGVAYGHSGFMPGYMSIVAYYPALKLTAALQINCDYATRKMKLTDYLDVIINSFQKVK